MDVANARPLLYLDVDGVLDFSPSSHTLFKNPSIEVSYYRVPNGSPVPTGLATAEDYKAYLKRLKRRQVRQVEGVTEDKIIESAVDPTRVAPLLAELRKHYDLVWATTWGGEANNFYSPLFDLPLDLPWVDFSHLPNSDFDNVPGYSGLFFKTRSLVEHAAGRRFFWLDDLSSSYGSKVTQRYLDDRLGKNHSRCWKVRDGVGLTLRDYEAALEWLTKTPE